MLLVSPYTGEGPRSQSWRRSQLEYLRRFPLGLKALRSVPHTHSLAIHLMQARMPLRSFHNRKRHLLTGSRRRGDCDRHACTLCARSTCPDTRRRSQTLICVRRSPAGVHTHSPVTQRDSSIVGRCVISSPLKIFHPSIGLLQQVRRLS